MRLVQPGPMLVAAAVAFSTAMVAAQWFEDSTPGGFPRPAPRAFPTSAQELEQSGTRFRQFTVTTTEKPKP